MDRETLRRLIEDTAVQRVKPGEPLMPGKLPGKTYSWQFYLRRVLYRADVIKYIGQEFKRRFEPIYQLCPFQISGVESASVPMLMAILMEWPELNCFTIRKYQKEYGLKNWFEGTPNNLPVLLVDDLVSQSHYTFNKGVKILEENNFKLINRVFVLVNKRYSYDPDHDVIILPDGNRIFTEYLFKLDDLAMEWHEYERALKNRQQL